MREKIKNIWNKLDLFGKISAIALAVFAILTLVAFFASRIVAGLISIVAIAIVVVALLMKKQVIKVPNAWIPLLAVILSLILVVPYFSLFKINISRFSRYNWNEVVLADMLPKPVSPYGEIISNSEDYFSLDVAKTTAVQYKEYIDACKDKGFTIDTESIDGYFDAYNASGYKISLSYYDSEMHITLDAAMELETITWPNSEMAKLLPIPKSTQGMIYSDNEDIFSVYIGNTSIDDYNDYVKTCEDKGFNVNSKKEDKNFSAKNSESNKLTVTYEGNNVIYISISQPEFDIKLEVECEENWIFNKYDINISIDDDFEGTIPHGDKEVFDVTLKKGTHTISFESSEDDTLDGEVEVDITKDETIKLKISCSSFGIDVEIISGAEVKDDNSSTTATKPDDTNLIEMKVDSADYAGKKRDDVEKEFKDIGFINVVIHEVTTTDTSKTNGEVTSVSAANDSFEKGDKFNKEDEIIIYCWKVEKPDTTQIVLPQERSKLGRDFDSKGTSTVYYINTDNQANTPKITNWGSAIVTDGVAEYLNYLKDLGFSVTITNVQKEEPRPGFHTYETNFKVSNSDISWTMYLMIQDEDFVEYELDIDLK